MKGYSNKDLDELLDDMEHSLYEFSVSSKKLERISISIILIFILLVIIAIAVGIDYLELLAPIFILILYPMARLINYLLTKEEESQLTKQYRAKILEPVFKTVLPHWAHTKHVKRDLVTELLCAYPSESGNNHQMALHRTLGDLQVWLTEIGVIRGTGSDPDNYSELFYGAVIRVDLKEKLPGVFIIQKEEATPPKGFSKQQSYVFPHRDSWLVYTNKPDLLEEFKRLNTIRLFLRYAHFHKIPIDKICLRNNALFIAIPYEQRFFVFDRPKDPALFLRSFVHTLNVLDDMVNFVFSQDLRDRESAELSTQ